MTDITQLIEALQAHKQADEEGIMCTVSRQAVSEAAEALKQCGWQPIETAPKDGSYVIGFCKFMSPWPISMKWSFQYKCWVEWASTEECDPSYWFPIPAFPDREVV